MKYSKSETFFFAECCIILGRQWTRSCTVSFHSVRCVRRVISSLFVYDGAYQRLPMPTQKPCLMKCISTITTTRILTLSQQTLRFHSKIVRTIFQAFHNFYLLSRPLCLRRHLVSSLYCREWFSMHFVFITIPFRLSVGCEFGLSTSRAYRQLIRFLIMYIHSSVCWQRHHSARCVRVLFVSRTAEAMETMATVIARHFHRAQASLAAQKLKAKSQLQSDCRTMPKTKEQKR